tara:strand:- start:9243 stop:9587 length:345 start_codon:yes stop_codon:yes gene_type:complete
MDADLESALGGGVRSVGGVCLAFVVAVLNPVVVGFILRGMERGGSLAVAVGGVLVCWVFEFREREKVLGVLVRSLFGLYGVFSCGGEGGYGRAGIRSIACLLALHRMRRRVCAL